MQLALSFIGAAIGMVLLFLVVLGIRTLPHVYHQWQRRRLLRKAQEFMVMHHMLHPDNYILPKPRRRRRLPPRL